VGWGWGLPDGGLARTALQNLLVWDRFPCSRASACCWRSWAVLVAFSACTTRASVIFVPRNSPPTSPNAVNETETVAQNLGVKRNWGIEGAYRWASGCPAVITMVGDSIVWVWYSIVMASNPYLSGFIGDAIGVVAGRVPSVFGIKNAAAAAVKAIAQDAPSRIAAATGSHWRRPTAVDAIGAFPAHHPLRFARLGCGFVVGGRFVPRPPVRQSQDRAARFRR